MSTRSLACGVLCALALVAGCTEPPDEPRPQASGAEGGERWRRLVTTLEGPHRSRSANRCVRGEYSCIALVVSEMRGRYETLAARCDHQAAFALMYLLVTEGVGAEGAHLFEDPLWLNHLDAVFARLYFSAYDDWQAGRRKRVPAAWAVAFQAAEARAVTGLGDMLLGMNAHISRDLPYALAEVGLDTADAPSPKADFDLVNDLLDEVQGPVLDGASERLDPTVERFAIPALNFTAADLADLLGAWRSEAWANAVALTRAATPAARQAVRTRIERNAESRARILQTATSYVLLGGSAEDREAFCRAVGRRATE